MLTRSESKRLLHKLLADLNDRSKTSAERLDNYAYVRSEFKFAHPALKSEFNKVTRKMVDMQRLKVEDAIESGKKSEIDRRLDAAKKVQNVTHSKSLSDFIGEVKKFRKSSEALRRSSNSRRSPSSSTRSSSSSRRSSEDIRKSSRSQLQREQAKLIQAAEQRAKRAREISRIERNAAKQEAERKSERAARRASERKAMLKSLSRNSERRSSSRFSNSRSSRRV